MEEEILTSKEVCHMLRISPAKLWRMYPELGGFRLGSEWRFRRSDIQAYIDQQKQAAIEYCAPRQAKEQARRGRGRESLNSELLKAEQDSELSLLYNLHS